MKTTTRFRPAALPVHALVALAAVVLITGCGGSKEGASQTAAKVDKAEITVHQINYVLQQQRNLRPEQAEAASKQILERLIEQQLALQKAEELKLDRDPRVVQQLEAARREVLARNYLDKVGEAAPKPTPEEIAKYYAEKPELFRERRIYSLQELSIEARPDQVGELKAKLASAASANEFMEYVKAQGYRFNAQQVVRAAEQLPFQTLDQLAKMKDGQALMTPAPTGAIVVVLANSRMQPVTEEQARPAIEQFLLNERRRKLIEDDMKSLRAAAKVEYVGTFAQGAAGAASGASAPAAAPGPAASGGLTGNDITKGLGIK